MLQNYKFNVRQNFLNIEMIKTLKWYDYDQEGCRASLDSQGKINLCHPSEVNFAFLILDKEVDTMASWGQLWAIGSISHLVHDLFAEAVYYRIPDNDRIFMDSSCTLVGGCSSQQYLRLFKSHLGHSWLPGLPRFHITLHTQCPPSHWTMEVFQSFDPSALFIAWDFPIIGKSVSSSVPEVSQAADGRQVQSILFPSWLSITYDNQA